MSDETTYLTPGQYWEYRYDHYVAMGYSHDDATVAARADTDERY